MTYRVVENEDGTFKAWYEKPDGSWGKLGSDFRSRQSAISNVESRIASDNEPATVAHNYGSGWSWTAPNGQVQTGLTRAQVVQLLNTQGGASVAPGGRSYSQGGGWQEPGQSPERGASDTQFKGDPAVTGQGGAAPRGVGAPPGGSTQESEFEAYYTNFNAIYQAWVLGGEGGVMAWIEDRDQEGMLEAVRATLLSGGQPAPGSGGQAYDVDTTGADSWLLQPSEGGYGSEDYQGSIQEWYETVTTDLVDQFFKGRWPPPGQGLYDFTGQGVPAPPWQYYGQVTPDSPGYERQRGQLDLFVQQYMTQLLNSGDFAQSHVGKMYGSPPSRSATFYDNNLDRQALLLTAERERNRHEEALLALSTEVKKVDAQMAADGNWIAIGHWLKKRGVLVNGLSLAYAKNMVPTEQLDSEDLAAIDPEAALDAHEASLREAVGPEGGYQGIPQQTFDQMYGGGQQSAAATAPAVDPATGLPAQGPPMQPGVPGVLPESPGYDPTAFQQYADQLQFGQGQNPGQLPDRWNALGLNVGEAYGHEVNAADFYNAPATEQRDKFNLVKSHRGSEGAGNFLDELESNRPKGGAGKGAFSYA